MHSNIPLVAIVGKANVGKSSLFNKIIKKRRAIIDKEPGVTRDINYEIVTYRNVKFRLADSAGITTTKKNKEDINFLAQSQNQSLINDSNLIIFTLDVKNFDGEDLDITKTIRKSGKPFIIAINKVDNNGLLENIYDFYNLGIDDPIPVSAIHGTNISFLLDKVVEKLKSKENGFKGAPLSEINQKANNTINIAIVGKPNVGKSSLLNLITEKTRSLVTPIPGTTRDVIDESILFDGYILKLLDTAGLKKRSRIRANVEFYSLKRTEKAIKNADIAVLIIDSNEGITNQDKKIASLVVNEKKGLIIAANKWDTVKEKGLNVRNFIEDCYYIFPHISYVDIINISAKTGYNKIKLLKNIIKVYNNYNIKIGTNELNNTLNCLNDYGLKVKYCFQKRTSPPEFDLFLAKINENDTNYKRFIINSIRKNFGLKGVPIEINLRKN